MNIVKQSKPIATLKKGDFITVNGKKLEVDTPLFSPAFL
jgi:hypothetical protein